MFTQDGILSPRCAFHAGFEPIVPHEVTLCFCVIPPIFQAASSLNAQILYRKTAQLPLRFAKPYSP